MDDVIVKAPHAWRLGAYSRAGQAHDCLLNPRRYIHHHGWAVVISGLACDQRLSETPW